MPLPRFGVSMYRLPGGLPGGDGVYEKEVTNSVVTRLDFNRIPAVAIEQKEPLAPDLEKATAALATAPGAKDVDVLVAGLVSPGGNTQVRIFSRDTRDGRLIARSEFEGEPNAAMQRAVDDAFAQVNRYWFELHRGQFSSIRLVVRGLRADADVAGLYQALAGVSGVQLTRHISTAAEKDVAVASFQVIFDGPPEAFATHAGGLQWKSGGQTVRLEQGEGFTFGAVYGN